MMKMKDSHIGSIIIIIIIVIIFIIISVIIFTIFFIIVHFPSTFKILGICG